MFIIASFNDKKCVFLLGLSFHIKPELFGMIWVYLRLNYGMVFMIKFQPCCSYFVPSKTVLGLIAAFSFYVEILNCL